MVVWPACVATLALGAGLGSDARRALLVALAGCVVAAPKRQRLLILAGLVAVSWGGVRAAMIDAAATPLPARTLVAEPLRMIDPLTEHTATSPPGAPARAVWRGRRVVVSSARFGRPTHELRRGWIVAATGQLTPLRASANDRRLAHQGIAGRIMLTSARDTGRRRGGMFGAVDRFAREASDVLNAAGGPRAGPLLAGMALGTAQGVAPDDRDTLRAAGLWHLAAASGGNVALIVALAMLLGWLAGLPDRGRLLLAAAAIVFYVPLAGGGPSIQRAGVMGLAALGALLLRREHRTADALGLAAVATLALDPRAWLDVGWQLSFAATAGLLAAVGPGQRALRRAGIPRPIAAALATTAAATLATAPIMLAAFGSISAIGLITNVVVTPLAAIAVWSGALAALLTPWAPHAALIVAQPGAAGASATLAVAAWGAGRTHAEVGVVGLGVAVIGAALVAVSRPGGAVVTAAGVIGLAWLAFDVPTAPHEPRLLVFDIGQGSAALLQAGDDAVLVDAGPVDGDVVRQLRRAGVRRLRAIVLSHPAADHDGGAAAVLRAIPTELLLDGGMPGGGQTHAAALREAARHHTRVVTVRAGQRLHVGQLSVWVRWPTPAAARTPGDPNDRAAVVQARIGPLAALIPADAESNVLTTIPNLAADVLVISHHGSDDPALPMLLRRLQPRAAVISVGAGNTYGHPTHRTLQQLRAAHVPTLRTDQDGAVDIRALAGRMVIRRHVR
jgi:competence protein ComEC